MSAETIPFEVVQRDEVERTLGNFEYVIDDTLEKAMEYNVCSQWSAEEAIDLIATVKTYTKKIEEVRKKVNEPYRKMMSYNNDKAKPFTDKLERIEHILKSKIDSWKRKEEAERAKLLEESKIMQEALQLEVNPFMGDFQDKLTIRTTDAMSYEKSEWKFEVTCLAEIPIQYLKVDEEKVKGIIKAGIREIPGIKVYEEKKTIVRSR